MRYVKSLFTKIQKREYVNSSFDDSIAKAVNNREVFEEALKSDDCVAILCNCMKNLEEKMNGMSETSIG